MGYYMAGGGVPWEALGGPVGAGYRIGRALADSPLGDSPLRAGAPAHTAAVARIAAAAARPQIAAQLQPQLERGDWGRGDLARGAPTDIPFGGDAPRYRRMNPLNPRALRRSMRRVQSFAKFARKTISFTQRVKMKKRRK